MHPRRTPPTSSNPERRIPGRRGRGACRGAGPAQLSARVRDSRSAEARATAQGQHSSVDLRWPSSIEVPATRICEDEAEPGRRCAAGGGGVGLPSPGGGSSPAQDRQERLGLPGLGTRGGGRRQEHGAAAGNPNSSSSSLDTAVVGRDDMPPPPPSIRMVAQREARQGRRGRRQAAQASLHDRRENHGSQPSKPCVEDERRGCATLLRRRSFWASDPLSLLLIPTFCRWG